LKFWHVLFPELLSIKHRFLFDIINDFCVYPVNIAIAGPFAGEKEHPLRYIGSLSHAQDEWVH
jgi:hypothetical protein